MCSELAAAWHRNCKLIIEWHNKSDAYLKVFFELDSERKKPRKKGLTPLHGVAEVDISVVFLDMSSLSLDLLQY